MIRFNSPKMCQKCESQIIIGGYVMLPDTEEIVHYCLKCAVECVKEYNKSKGIDTTRIQIVENLEDLKDDNRGNC